MMCRGEDDYHSFYWNLSATNEGWTAIQSDCKSPSELCLTSQTPPLIPSLEAGTRDKEPLSSLSESCLNPFHAESVNSDLKDLKGSVDIKRRSEGTWKAKRFRDLRHVCPIKLLKTHKLTRCALIRVVYMMVKVLGYKWHDPDRCVAFRAWSQHYEDERRRCWNHYR